ncbi:MAG: dTMP kinase [Bacillota bacterium]
MTEGLFITLEGIDGSGKTTQARLLTERLQSDHIPYLLLREPGGTTVGESIRQILLGAAYSITLETEVLLYAAARAELVKEVIRPALTTGHLVVCDRYIDSTTAYQGYGAGENLAWIHTLNEKVTGGLAPRLTFLLDLSVEEALLRRGGGGDRIEIRNQDYHERVRRGYLILSELEPERFRVIDASLAPAEQQRIIWQEINKYIEK